MTWKEWKHRRTRRRALTRVAALVQRRAVEARRRPSRTRSRRRRAARRETRTRTTRRFAASAPPEASRRRRPRGWPSRSSRRRWTRTRRTDPGYPRRATWRGSSRARPAAKTVAADLPPWRCASAPGPACTVAPAALVASELQLAHPCAKNRTVPAPASPRAADGWDASRTSERRGVRRAPRGGARVKARRGDSPRRDHRRRRERGASQSGRGRSEPPPRRGERKRTRALRDGAVGRRALDERARSAEGASPSRGRRGSSRRGPRARRGAGGDARDELDERRRARPNAAGSSQPLATKAPRRTSVSSLGATTVVGLRTRLPPAARAALAVFLVARARRPPAPRVERGRPRRPRARPRARRPPRVGVDVKRHVARGAGRPARPELASPHRGLCPWKNCARVERKLTSCGCSAWRRGRRRARRRRLVPRRRRSSRSASRRRRPHVHGAPREASSSATPARARRRAA